MNKIYLKLHYFNPLTLSLLALLLFYALWLLPYSVDDHDGFEICCFSFFSSQQASLVWLPVFSIFILFGQNMFRKDLVSYRFASVKKYWRSRCGAIAADALFYTLFMQMTFFLFFVTKNELPMYLQALPYLPFRFFLQFLALFLFSLIFSAVSFRFRSPMPGLAVVYVVVYTEFCMNFWGHMQTFFLLNAIYSAPENVLDFFKALLAPLVCSIGVYVLAVTLFEQFDYLDKEEG